MLLDTKREGGKRVKPAGARKPERVEWGGQKKSKYGYSTEALYTRLAKKKIEVFSFSASTLETKPGVASDWVITQMSPCFYGESSLFFEGIKIAGPHFDSITQTPSEAVLRTSEVEILPSMILMCFVQWTPSWTQESRTADSDGPITRSSQASCSTWPSLEKKKTTDEPRICQQGNSLISSISLGFSCPGRSDYSGTDVPKGTV